MALFGTIYAGYPNNLRVQRSQVAALFNKLPVAESLDYDMSTIKSPEYLAKFPMGKVPAFEGTDGFTLTEGSAITWYIAASGPNAEQLLRSSSPQTAATIMQWSFFADSELLDNLYLVTSMALMQSVPWDDKRFDNAMAAVERALKRIELALTTGENGSDGKFLVGSKGATLADIMVGSVLLAGMKRVIDKEMRAAFPATTKYTMDLFKMNEFKTVFLEAKLVEQRPSKP